MLSDVTVGSVGNMTFRDWHADVEVFVKPGVYIPANAVAAVGQTSLLGSSHISLDPPIGAAPIGQLAPGSTIPLNRSSTYPSTERTLSSLSIVVNGGGLGQLGDIVTQFNSALGGRETAIRDLLARLDTFVSTIDAQRAEVIATVQAMNRLSGTLAGQRNIIAGALEHVPQALEVLQREHPDIIEALNRLRTFSDTAVNAISGIQTGLLDNLHHLEPTIHALADVGTDIDLALSTATTYPIGQYAIDHAIKGDYTNLSGTLDLTVPALKKGLLAGTRWGDPDAMPQPAVGDPGYDAHLDASASPGSAPLLTGPSVSAPGSTAAPGDPPETPAPPPADHGGR